MSCCCWECTSECFNIAKGSFSNSSIIDETKQSETVILDENYLDKLIDLELRNVPSSLGLVWSKLSCTSNPNEFLFKTNPNTVSSSSQKCYHFSSSEASSHTISNTCQPVSNIHQAESATKLSKKKKPKKDNNKPNYRVRFSYNKFEEIEFRKSNPKKKFIIFKE
ncbi:predicted protein [Naegleria gruberi]|uniref:Predicted protein n=1 Tax=Naegleria gruberi TaxID=5762 RepID=D2VDC9_NAEGR|nr:uncharacterized protein NAEGRDRAFT_66798 [Naegleria gruberi]EFC45123.1 predicted protein [Naegleria gruberi]|eukprot:XP_002677867.1 predicted protein [Naegleria gruberi strain NEG-M]